MTLQKIRLSLVCGAAVLGMHSLASAKAYPGAYSESCRLNQSDAYDRGWQFPANAKSPHRGQCLDTSEKRPAFLLQLNDGGIRFANFHYQGDFYEISIPRMAVSRVIFQTENFAKVGPIQPAHTQMRFILNQDAKLIYQYGARKGQVYKNIRDIILSVDYMAPKGVKYKPLTGIQISGVRENFMNAYRFISTQDRYEDRVVKVGRTIRQYLLKLTPEQMDATLKYAAYFSHDKQTEEVYSLASLNCTTALFGILGQVTGQPRLKWYVEPGYLMDPIAGFSVVLLNKAGLLAGELPTLNEEMKNR